MVYQSSKTSQTDTDGSDTYLTLLRKNSGNETWSDNQDFLSDIENPRIGYQFIESDIKDSEGYSKEILIPIFHLSVEAEEDENYDPDDNYELVVRVDRNLGVEESVFSTKIEQDLGKGAGYLQSSIVRVPSDSA